MNLMTKWNVVMGEIEAWCAAPWAQRTAVLECHRGRWELRAREKTRMRFGPLNLTKNRKALRADVRYILYGETPEEEA